MGFLFREKKAESGWTLYTQQAENTLQLFTTHEETTQTFACSYLGENKAGDVFQSSLSNEVVISIADPPPPAPHLTLNPSGSTFTRVERVWLICHLPEGRRATDFLFYKKNADGGWTRYEPQKSNALELSTAHLMPVESFVCCYKEESNSQQQSAQSNMAEFSVTELPPATLSLVPQQPVYIQGEPVTLECSAPQRLNVTGYKFYKKQQGRGFKELPDKRTRHYELFRVRKSNTGEYSCLYWILLSGQEIPSPRSSPVFVAMTDRPRAPLVSMFPQQKVYKSGESVNLTCSPLENHRLSRIQFFKDGGQLHLIKLSPSSVIFTHTLRLLPEDGGEYSCMYHVTESGREIPSQESVPIRISVMAVDPSTTWPTFSDTDQALLGTAVTKGATDTSAMPTSEASRPSSSQPATIETTLTYPERHTEPRGSTAATSSSPQPSLYHNASSSTHPQETTKSTTVWNVMNSLGPRMLPSPSPKAKEDSSSLFLWLSIGCGLGGGLLFLAILVAIYTRKNKDNRQIATRTYWRSLNFQTSMKRRRCNADPMGVSINLQEGNQNEQLQPMTHDWGILRKTKSPALQRGYPSPKKKRRNEDADSGADVGFPDIDPTYTLLGFSCSTFFQERNDESAEETHIYGEPFF